jgi:hypothetical protein
MSNTDPKQNMGGELGCWRGVNIRNPIVAFVMKISED